MSLTNLGTNVREIFETNWDITNSTIMPSVSNLGLDANHARKLQATILYSDLANSSAMVETLGFSLSAKIFKSFLACTTRISKSNGATIASFDGDRVMSIFTDEQKKNTNAVKTSLQINYAVKQIIQPQLTKWLQSGKNFSLEHGTGIDTSEVFVIKAGQRGDNDLVWVGRSPNYAAKLSAIRDEKYSTFISENVFNSMCDSVRYGGQNNQLMWVPSAKPFKWIVNNHRIYASSWWGSF
jgi:adenylate cyclase